MSVGGTCQPVGRELIGWQFQKKFVSYGVWTGQVVHFDEERDGDDRYVGRYEDGTDEWYTLRDLRNKFNITKNTKSYLLPELILLIHIINRNILIMLQMKH